MLQWFREMCMCVWSGRGGGYFIINHKKPLPSEIIKARFSEEVGEFPLVELDIRLDRISPKPSTILTVLHLYPGKITVLH